MKKIITGLMLGVTVLGFMSACGRSDGNSKPSDESNNEAAIEEVRNFGKNFTQQASAGQLEALAASYPELSDVKTVVPLNSENIIVTQPEAGLYQITLADGVTMNVTRSDDGAIKIVDSHGLFVFPEDKVEIAKKTGMWNDNLSDAQLNERMKDEDFFKWVKNNGDVKINDIISVGKTINDGGTGDLSDPNLYHVILTNNSNVPIKGSEYKIKWEYWNPYQDHNPTYNYEKGKDIPANGTVRIDWSDGGESESYLKGVKWNLSSEQLKEKFGKPFTGNEYQEYLNNKK